MCVRTLLVQHFKSFRYAYVYLVVIRSTLKEYLDATPPSGTAVASDGRSSASTSPINMTISFRDTQSPYVSKLQLTNVFVQPPTVSQPSELTPLGLTTYQYLFYPAAAGLYQVGVIPNAVQDSSENGNGAFIAQIAFDTEAPTIAASVTGSALLLRLGDDGMSLLSQLSSDDITITLKGDSVTARIVSLVRIFNSDVYTSQVSYIALKRLNLCSSLPGTLMETTHW